MAENVILKTQILLRNDTAANWTAANPVLGQGEVGLETDTKKFKVGDGTTAWSALDYYNANYTDEDEVIQIVGNSLNNYSTTEQMNQAIEDAIGEIPSVDLSSVTNTHREVSSKEALDAIAAEDLVKGDIGVVRTVIAHDSQDENPIFSYTAYVWNGTAWAAMDGNYNAENVYFDEDLISTYAIGNVTLTNGQGTVESTGKNLKEVWSSIFQKPTDPTVDEPTTTLTATGNSEKEVGYTFDMPVATLTVTDIGSYSYGPADTGVRFPAESLEIIQDDKTTHKVSNTSVYTKGDTITLTAENTKGNTYGDIAISYKFTATSKYTPDANVIPVNNLGTEKPALRIGYNKTLAEDGTLALTVSGAPKTTTFTGCRKMFWGTMASKPATMTSDDIRGLSGLVDTSGSWGTKNANGIKAAIGERSLTIPVGCYRVVIAVPAARTVSKVLDVNDSNANIVGSFKSMTVDVFGANNYTATSYKVYYLDYANANDQANTYKVTIA